MDDLSRIAAEAKANADAEISRLLARGRGRDPYLLDRDPLGRPWDGAYADELGLPYDPYLGTYHRDYGAARVAESELQRLKLDLAEANARARNADAEFQDPIAGSSTSPRRGSEVASVRSDSVRRGSDPASTLDVDSTTSSIRGNRSMASSARRRPSLGPGPGSSISQAAALRRSLSPLGLHPGDPLDPLYVARARDAVVIEEENAARMLEQENIRLVETRSVAEAERDALRIEVLRLKGELEETTDVLRLARKEHRLDAESKDRRAERLLAEINELKAAVEQHKDAHDTKHAELVRLRDAHSALQEDHADERGNSRKLRQNVDELTERHAELEEKLQQNREIKTTVQSQYKALLVLIAELQKGIQLAGKHADDCAARGYFASKSRRLHNHFAQLNEDLIDLAAKLDTSGKGRRRTEEKIQRMMD